MKAHAKILKNHAVFSRFANRTLNRLTAHSKTVEYPKGQVVYKTGDPADAMYLILSGRCQGHVLLPDGSEQILDIYAPGDTFGERALVSGDRHWATVKVITDCVLLRIEAEDVNYLLDKSPRLARELILKMVDQLNAYRRESHPGDLGRVVVLTELSDRIMGTEIAENVATALSREMIGSVLYLHFVHDRDKPLLLEWKDIHELFNDGVMKAGGGEAHKIQLGICDDAREPEMLAPLISEMARHYRYVIALLDDDIPAAVVMEFIEQADLAYVLFRQRPEDLYRANLLLRQVGEFPQYETYVLPVLCLDYEERARSFGELKASLGIPVHGVVHCLPRGTGEDLHTHFARSSKGRFSTHIRRLAREIGRCQVGLALSSGGAKGLSYVGIIQVLEENDIHVDVVAGTSMGAYIGALWASGLSGQEMEPLALDMQKPWAVLRLIDPIIPPRRGFIRGNRVRRLLKRSIGDAHFSDLSLQLRVVATDLNTLEKIVFDSGEVAPCVQCSIAMPGVFAPVELNGRTIIDGGIADPLPVDVLIEMGVERIIAVNTIPTPEVMRSRDQASREVAGLSKKHLKAMSALGNFVNYFAPGNILDIMMRGIHGAQTRVSEGSCKQADVVLRPLAPDGRWHDFESAGKYVKLGREVAEAQLEELKALVR